MRRNHGLTVVVGEGVSGGGSGVRHAAVANEVAAASKVATASEVAVAGSGGVRQRRQRRRAVAACSSSP